MANPDTEDNLVELTERLQNLRVRPGDEEDEWKIDEVPKRPRLADEILSTERNDYSGTRYEAHPRSEAEPRNERKWIYTDSGIWIPNPMVYLSPGLFVEKYMSPGFLEKWKKDIEEWNKSWSEGDRPWPPNYRDYMTVEELVLYFKDRELRDQREIVWRKMRHWATTSWQKSIMDHPNKADLREDGLSLLYDKAQEARGEEEWLAQHLPSSQFDLKKPGHRFHLVEDDGCGTEHWHELDSVFDKWQEVREDFAPSTDEPEYFFTAVDNIPVPNPVIRILPILSPEHFMSEEDHQRWVSAVETFSQGGKTRKAWPPPQYEDYLERARYKQISNYQGDFNLSHSMYKIDFLEALTRWRTAVGEDEPLDPAFLLAASKEDDWKRLTVYRSPAFVKLAAGLPEHWRWDYFPLHMLGAVGFPDRPYVEGAKQETSELDDGPHMDEES